jgi:hypothetical protein
MYRFRKIESLIGQFQELENQEIYFASPEELNDPMEGYRELFWDGDAIVWKNFIINYTKSLEYIFALTIIVHDEKKIDESDILISQRLLGFRAPENRKIIQQVLDSIFKIEFIRKLPETLTKRVNPIRRNELLSYLQLIHLFILNSISEVYYENQLTDKLIYHQNLDEFKRVLKRSGVFVSLLNKLEKTKTKTVSNALFTISNMYSQSMTLLAKYNMSKTGISSNGLFLISEFPEKFISKLESEIYPKWHSASFLYECSNSAIWGHYGDNHKGVCLKFKSYEGDSNLTLNLETEYGYNNSGPIIGMTPHTFHKIQYHNKHVEIDFFRSIARMNKSQINTLWYSDSDGNLSVCGEPLNENEDEWRRNYWGNFYNSLTVKLKEWEYEQEYRLIIHGDLTDYSDANKRKLKYDFNDLEGIIFGIKTENTDKFKIIKVIEEKCKANNRTQFEFFQAYYSKDTGKIETYKLDILKLE